MKKIAQLISLSIGLVLMFSFTPGPEQHLGTWKGSAGGKAMIFTFHKEGFLDCVLGEYVADGKEFTREGGVKAQTRYSIDYSVNPIAIDIVVSEIKSGKELDRLKGIIEFKSDKKMKLVLAPKSKSPRPTSFKKCAKLNKI